MHTRESPTHCDYDIEDRQNKGQIAFNFTSHRLFFESTDHLGGDAMIIQGSYADFCDPIRNLVINVFEFLV